MLSVNTITGGCSMASTATAKPDRNSLAAAWLVMRAPSCCVTVDARSSATVTLTSMVTLAAMTRTTTSLVDTPAVAAKRAAMPSRAELEKSATSPDAMNRVTMTGGRVGGGMGAGDAGGNAG